ncbi:GPI mannosyltransferase 3 [Seminavis robusta]|uniref:Mannosyltransferase n=1 Tax=Seminavis robusta TaxID=568900 RepID=A0A9N8D5U5_9STRA|nr:GPI mannosyltransferase 3 [Seminavis robusta]|eukprot:Sro13_g009700.1 GPI mannosyltransferase 3 (645) ;mRNA; r:10036-11970
MWPKIKTTVAVFLGVCTFRLLNTFLVQSFFDPDEFWQTLEPAYCQVFWANNQHKSSSLNLDCEGYTWEWKRRPMDKTSLSFLDRSFQGPIRSYLSVLPFHFFYLWLEKRKWDSHFWVSQGPKWLMAIMAAAPTDVAVWILAHWTTSVSEEPYYCLFCSMASWFHGYTLVRTYSNTMETTLLTISMVLLAPEILGKKNTAMYCTMSSTIRHCLCFLLGGCSVAMRFSSIAAWVPMGVILAIQQSQESTQQSSATAWYSKLQPALVTLLGTCAVFGAMGIGIACVVDYCVYGFWTIPFLGSFHFNVLLGNSALYGSHPWHWYITAGIPAITGLWLPFVLNDLWLLVVAKSPPPNNTMARRNVWIIIATYALAHSLSGHKEFRFLLPILPLFCLQAGPHVRSLVLWLSKARATNGLVMFWLALLFLPNLIALLYLGLFHQNAPISVNHKIAAMAQEYSTMQQSESHSRHTFSVHYLTGACHSTPLHSYLHGPGPVRFSTWSLDCSPSCRSDPKILCESEQFAKDPVGFVDQAYPVMVSDPTSCQDSIEGSCSAMKLPPDFLVTYADYATKLQSRIETMGLHEVGRFSHGINGLKLGTTLQTGDGYDGEGNGLTKEELAGTYKRIGLIGGVVELSIDEMVLYASAHLP